MYNNSDYPVGADNVNAPWNEQDPKMKEVCISEILEKEFCIPEIYESDYENFEVSSNLSAFGLLRLAGKLMDKLAKDDTINLSVWDRSQLWALSNACSDWIQTDFEII